MDIGKIVRVIVIPDPAEKPVEQPILVPEWPVRKEAEVDA